MATGLAGARLRKSRYSGKAEVWRSSGEEQCVTARRRTSALRSGASLSAARTSRPPSSFRVPSRPPARPPGQECVPQCAFGDASRVPVTRDLHGEVEAKYVAPLPSQTGLLSQKPG